MMTKLEKTELKKLLPRKWVGTLSERTRLSKVYIRKVMSGTAHSFAIEKAALILAEEYKKEIISTEQIKEKLI